MVRVLIQEDAAARQVGPPQQCFEAELVRVQAFTAEIVPFSSSRSKGYE
jgi:hypothetical protein